MTHLALLPIGIANQPARGKNTKPRNHLRIPYELIGGEEGRAFTRSSPYSVIQMDLKRCFTILKIFLAEILLGCGCIKHHNNIPREEEKRKPSCEQSKNWDGTTKYMPKRWTQTFHSNHRILVTI